MKMMIEIMSNIKLNNRSSNKLNARLNMKLSKVFTPKCLQLTLNRRVN